MDCFPVLHSQRPVSGWCSPTISSSATLFSFCLQSFPASGSFTTSWLFKWGGQSIGASASVFPMNFQGWFPLELTGLISFALQGTLESSSAPQFKSPILWHSAFFMVQLSYLYMTTGKKKHIFDYMDLCWQSNVSFLICYLGLPELFFQGASIF